MYGAVVGAVMMGGLRRLALGACLAMSPAAWTADSQVDCFRQCSLDLEACLLAGRDDCAERNKACRQSCAPDGTAQESALERHVERRQRLDEAKRAADQVAELLAKLREIRAERVAPPERGGPALTPQTKPGSHGPFRRTSETAHVFAKTMLCSQLPLWACDFLDSENARNLDAAMEAKLREAWCGTANITGSYGHCEAGLALDPEKCGKFLTIRDSSRGKRREVACASRTVLRSSP